MKTALALAAAGGGTLFSAGAAFAGGFPAPYCTRAFTNAVEPITLVRISNIDNASGAAVNGTPALEDFTAIVGTLRPGSVYPIRTEGNSDGNFANLYRVYFDWNQDSVFNEDASERVEIGTITNSTGIDGKFASTNVTIPVTAMSGTTRMRIVKKYSTAGTACGPDPNNSYGQAEDYTVNIDPGATIPPPLPTLAKAFSPPYADASLPTTLTISLGQLNADVASLTLTANLVDTLPAGMTVAATPNASTTCPSGVVTAVAGSGSVALATGAQIPPAGCNVSVDVQVAAAGTFANTFAANSLQTDGGNYAPAVTAYYQATAPGLPTYGAGFEAPAFGLGNLPQGDWGRGGGVAADTRIVIDNPAAGAQNLRMSWATAGSGTVAAISPTFAPGTKAYSVASAKLSISTPVGTGTDFDFAPQDPAANSVVARIRFARPAAGVNRIMRLDPNGTSPGVSGYVDTGATWAPGAYFDVKVITNRAAQTYDVCLNGTAIVTGAPAFARHTSNIAIIGAKGGTTQNNILDADEVVLDNTNFGTCNGLPIQRTVTPSVGTPSGSISPATPVSVDDGSTTQFTLTADAGFHIDTVGGTCGGSLAGNVFTTAAVTADCTVVANFAADVVTHTVTPSVGTPSGSISPATPQVVNDGATTQFTLTADA
ncbi:MAG TPA: GEVED domain-containing protein, partial [Dokdonella sp.]